jgi:hypothetical protein
MKQSITWHKVGAFNRAKGLERDRRNLDELQARFIRNRNDLAFLQAQIAEAERRGMDAFDSDRLLVKRAK